MESNLIETLLENFDEKRDGDIWLVEKKKVGNVL